MAISYTLVYFIDKHYKKNGRVRFIIKRVYNERIIRHHGYMEVPRSVRFMRNYSF
ncbi:MAG TPA: hypothetical protein VEG39_20320 [Clostridia bacterium]|nr:hypothetical protein [Clostridia bacterium]